MTTPICPTVTFHAPGSVSRPGQPCFRRPLLVRCGGASCPKAPTRCPEDASRTETFDTEPEALIRARELIEDGDCYAVAIRDDSGEVLGGIRLQLKLGLAAE